jgi:hypothetical protein
MATKKTTNPEFVEAPEAVEEVVVEATPEKEVVAPGAPATKKGRVKGTWTMYWGTDVFNFEDGQTYTLPTGLYNYLADHGNIYDTL